MTDLDQASERALAAMNALYATTEAARARFADLRDYLAAAGERLETDWPVLRERAIHFQQQAAGEAQLLAAGQSSVEQALSAVHGATGQVLEEVPPEVAATHGGFEEMAARVDALETETTRVVEQADEAEAALQARLEEVETPPGGAGRRGRPAALGADRGAQGVRTGDREARPSIWAPTSRASACRRSAPSRRSSTRCWSRPTRTCGRRWNPRPRSARSPRSAPCASAPPATTRSSAQIGRLGDSMEELLKDLRDFVDDGRERLEDRQERWEDRAEDTSESLRDALDKLKELQDHLARHGFH